MNLFTHFLFSLFILKLVSYSSNLFFQIFVCITLNLIIDLDHLLPGRLKRKRRWIQEPFGIILFSCILFFILRLNWKISFLIPFSHLFLDYLCIYEAYPLAPFTYKVKKPICFGVVIPDDLLNSKHAKFWKRLAKIYNCKGISENYVTLIFLLLLIFIEILD